MTLTPRKILMKGIKKIKEKATKVLALLLVFSLLNPAPVFSNVSLGERLFGEFLKDFHFIGHAKDKQGLKYEVLIIGAKEGVSIIITKDLLTKKKKRAIIGINLGRTIVCSEDIKEKKFVGNKAELILTKSETHRGVAKRNAKEVLRSLRPKYTYKDINKNVIYAGVVRRFHFKQSEAESEKPEFEVSFKTDEGVDEGVKVITGVAESEIEFGRAYDFEIYEMEDIIGIHLFPRHGKDSGIILDISKKSKVIIRYTERLVTKTRIEKDGLIIQEEVEISRSMRR